MHENELSAEIIGSAIEVHKALGLELLENVYKSCLAHKLQQKGFTVETEKPMPVRSNW